MNRLLLVLLLCWFVLACCLFDIMFTLWLVYCLIWVFCWCLLWRVTFTLTVLFVLLWWLVCRVCCFVEFVPRVVWFGMLDFVFILFVWFGLYLIVRVCWVLGLRFGIVLLRYLLACRFGCVYCCVFWLLLRFLWWFLHLMFWVLWVASLVFCCVMLIALFYAGVFAVGLLDSFMGLWFPLCFVLIVFGVWFALVGWLFVLVVVLLGMLGFDWFVCLWFGMLICDVVGFSLYSYELKVVLCLLVCLVFCFLVCWFDYSILLVYS